jgi:hypothetical protein
MTVDTRLNEKRAVVVSKPAAAELKDGRVLGCSVCHITFVAALNTSVRVFSSSSYSCTNLDLLLLRDQSLASSSVSLCH